jgi:uncharacterized protein
MLSAKLRLQSGVFFEPFNPDFALIDIRDITCGLSHINRYQGQTLFHYSVAQHSLLVSKQVSKKNKLYALLHDASEAYLGDVIGPFKEMPEFDFFLKAEKVLQDMIYRRFGLEPTIPDEVLRVDIDIRANEIRGLFPCQKYSDSQLIPDLVIKPMVPDSVYVDFYGEFLRLMSKRK